ncbi:hypothetical protein [Bosea sp. F3-2]|uniref:hypothetical protein n=1 Tax=Bosea sp. F3-2 TaxID=2599640 RepID=UPI0020C0B0DD|nr:hypothetical protein [Bosea sp. F3-2]
MRGNTILRPQIAAFRLDIDMVGGIQPGIIARDPAVMLDHGDPQSLRPGQRVRALKAYVERYGRGGWRGLKTPSIQVRRFASAELTQSVNELWAGGVSFELRSNKVRSRPRHLRTLPRRP